MKFKTNMVVQSNGIEISEADVIAKVKEIWTSAGKLVKDIKSITTYVKPEDRKVYYVVNDEVTGSFDV